MVSSGLMKRALWSGAALALMLWSASAAAKPKGPSEQELAQAWAQALRQRAPWPQAQLEVTQIKGLKPKARCDQWRVEPDYVGGWTPQISAQLYCEGARSPHRLRARLDVQVSVPVLTKAITRGEDVTQAVIWQPSSLWALPSDHVSDVSQLEGKVSRMSMSAGQVLRAGALEAPMLVTHGQVVVLVVRRGAVQLTDRAVALGPGRLGEWVMAKSQSTQKVLRAQVKADGSLEVF